MSAPTTFRARWRAVAFCAALTAQERLILQSIADHIVHEEEVFCGVARLGTMTGISTRAIHGHLQALERKGALTVSRSTGRANRYLIQWGWLTSSTPAADVTSADPAPVQNLRQRSQRVKPAQILRQTSADPAHEVIEVIEVNSPPPTVEVTSAEGMGEEDHTQGSPQPVDSSPQEAPTASSPAEAPVAAPEPEPHPALSRAFSVAPWRLPEPIGRPLWSAGLRTWSDIAACTRDALKVLGGWERDIKGNLDLIESFLSKATDGTVTLRSSTYDAPGAASGGTPADGGMVGADGRILSAAEVTRRANADWALVDGAVRKYGRLQPPRLRAEDTRLRWHFGGDPATHERILAVLDRAALSWVDLCNADTYEEEVQRKRFVLAWPAGAIVGEGVAA